MQLSLSDLRQSTAELLACAVLDLFPGALLVEGVSNEFGFYYDFIAQQPIDDYALVLLEEKMRGLIKPSREIRTLDMMRENAAVFFTKKEQPYIAERVKNARDNIVSIFQLGDFHDYCPCPQPAETEEMAAFRLFQVEKVLRFIPEEGEVPVTRIHGTAFYDLQTLKQQRKASTQAAKKDHREMARKSEFFESYPAINAKSYVWQSTGADLRRALINCWEEAHAKEGFIALATPPFIKDELLQKTGFYDQAAAGEYPPECNIEDVSYVLPTSLSPVHAAIFNAKKATISDLPMRFAECGWVANIDKQKHLGGVHDSLFVYGDFAHIFCSTGQVEKELISSLQFIDKIIKMFCFEYHWCLKGLSSPRHAGSPARWTKANESLVAAFNACGMAYTVDETEPSFVGPRAEAQLIDSSGRTWKGPYIGFDFNCPERLNLRYQEVNKEAKMPVMLVRSLFGSVERFSAILMEHQAGHIPAWLSSKRGV